jgi:hypothetical protein
VDRDDLLKLLDLQGKEAVKDNSADVPITPADVPPPAVHASPTALELDD